MLEKDIDDKFGNKFDKIMEKIKKDRSSDTVNDVFTELWNHVEIQSLLTRISAGYAKKMDVEEVESLKMQALWDSIRKFKFEKNTKFTTFLYLMLSYSLLSNWKKTPKHKLLYAEISTHQVSDIEEIVDTKQLSRLDAMEYTVGLNEDMAEVVDNYFFKNLSTCEMAKKYGYSRETARRKVNKALKYMKKMT